MNNEFKRMQKLAGILSEGYQGTDYESSEDMALDMVKTGAGLPGGLPEMKTKMTKSEAKKMIKDAILAEMAHDDDPEDMESMAWDYAMREAKKDEEVPEEEVEVSDEETIEEPAPEEDMIDADMEGGLDMDAGSDEAKTAFDELTDAYRSAKELGDEKLIRQLANTITYFNKNIILK